MNEAVRFQAGEKVVRVNSEASWVPLGARGIVDGEDPETPGRYLVSWVFCVASKDGESFGLAAAKQVSCSAHKMLRIRDAAPEQLAFVGVVEEPGRQEREMDVDQAIEAIKAMLGAKMNPAQMN